MAQASSNSTTSQTKDASNNTNTESQQQLLTQGKDLLKQGQYEEASAVLSQAVELVSALHIDNPYHYELSEYYLKYGEAVFNLTKYSNDLLGSEVRSKQKEMAEAKAQLEEADKEEQTSTSTAVSATTSATTEDAAESAPTDAPTADAPENAEAEAEEKEGSDVDPFGRPDVDTAEDRQVAWESLENARVIIEHHLKENKSDRAAILRLSDVHSLLGEHQMEDERFDDSINEFENALNAQRMLQKPEARELAFLHYMASLSASHGGRADKMKEHTDAAINVITNRLAEILNAVTPDAITAKDSREKIESKVDSFLAANDENSTLIAAPLREEMESLRSSIDDLTDKMIEGPSAEMDAEEAAMVQMAEILGKAGFGGLFAGDEEGDYEDDDEECYEGDEAEADEEDEELEDAVPLETGVDENSPKNAEAQPPAVVESIGFGDSAKDDDCEPVNELGSFGKGNNRKRSSQEAGIAGGEPTEKKVRVNSA